VYHPDAHKNFSFAQIRDFLQDRSTNKETERKWVLERAEMLKVLVKKTAVTLRQLADVQDLLLEILNTSPISYDNMGHLTMSNMPLRTELAQSFDGKKLAGRNRKY